MGSNTHHICSLIFLPPSSTVLILKSIPVTRRRRDIRSRVSSCTARVGRRVTTGSLRDS